MVKRDFCGCCSLGAGGVFTGLLASVYNGALFYWFFVSYKAIKPDNGLILALQALLMVLMCLAAVHIIASLAFIYAIVKKIPDLVMLWAVIYISSCLVVASLFTIGLAFMMDKMFLLIILCNFVFIFNVTMAMRLYNVMVEDVKKEAV